MTYSIIAKCSKTGQIGVATQSNWFNVGRNVPYAKAGVGVVATQSFINPIFGEQGLELMKTLTPKDALELLLKNDDNREKRQVAFLNTKGEIHAFTGNECVPYAEQMIGQDFCTLSNLMKNTHIPEIMGEAFQNYNGCLARKMMAAMQAAQNAEGDLRGTCACCMIILNPTPSTTEAESRLVNLRVEDHHNPIEELFRLLQKREAYDYLNLAIELLEQEKTLEAEKAFQLMRTLDPKNQELIFWESFYKKTNCPNLDSNWIEFWNRIKKN